jgi:hypothetical protein
MTPTSPSPLAGKGLGRGGKCPQPHHNTSRSPPSGCPYPLSLYVRAGMCIHPHPRITLFVTGGAGFISSNFVRAWHHTYGLPVTTSNCSNNYGPWHFPEKLIPLMMANAELGHPSGTMSTEPSGKP